MLRCQRSTARPAALAFIVAAAVATTGAALAGELVEFHIKAGTSDGPWNKREDVVTVHVGDTLRLVNDDLITHRLHTFGKPCPHGDDMAPGQSWDCVIRTVFDPATDGPLWDHYYEDKGEFWVRAIR
jgi:hypothetical protein